VVSGAMWQLIFTALEIKRFGVGMVIPYPKQVEKKEGGKNVFHGSFFHYYVRTRI